MTTDAQPARSKFASRHATPEQWARFLSALEQRWTVSRACRAAQVSDQAAYKRRRRNHEFTSAWHTAQCVGCDANRDRLFGLLLECDDKNREVPTSLDVAFAQNNQIYEQLMLEEEAVWRPFHAKLKNLREGFTPPSVQGSRPKNFLTGRRHSIPDRDRPPPPPGETEAVVRRPSKPRDVRPVKSPGKGRAGVLW